MTKHPVECTQLIELTLAGSREAFGELYEATVEDVYKAVRFFVSAPSDAEDVVQEIYMEVHRSLGRYDRSRPLRPWLMGVAMRQIQSHRRKGWRQLRIRLKAEQSGLSIEEDFAREVVERLANRPLLAAVHTLPFKLKQVVILHYGQEYSQEEIAAILDIPLGTVKSRIYAALQKLRRKHRADTIRIGKVEDLHESGT
ncbi:sigma-70 family RNA polymerase sigma factor [Paenibacillus tengchongensis]|uniref:sigma-70 family RNA polymerase sigma factor n=1 Tax=Paenibacillus tengchongensis TaxID=2608684 RepID=UPI00124E609E|nr:sigma-70 family RNA polymerase sigma factor [Paenibacillus tengchongensis]